MFLTYKGAFSANPVLIYKAPINIVIDTYKYLVFMDKYQLESKALNS